MEARYDKRIRPLMTNAFGYKLNSPPPHWGRFVSTTRTSSRHQKLITATNRRFMIFWFCPLVYFAEFVAINLFYGPLKSFNYGYVDIVPNLLSLLITARLMNPLNSITNDSIEKLLWHFSVLNLFLRLCRSTFQGYGVFYSIYHITISFYVWKTNHYFLWLTEFNKYEFEMKIFSARFLRKYTEKHEKHKSI